MKNIIHKTLLGTLYLGDSKELIKNIPDNSVDLILTDPPYFYESINNKKKYESKSKVNAVFNKLNDDLNLIQANKNIDIEFYLNEFKRISKSQLFLIWMNKEQIFYYIKWVKENGYYFDFYIWEKLNPLPSNNFIYQDKEFCIVIYKYEWNMRVPNYLTEYENKKTFFHSPIGQESNGHPTPKPIKDIEFLIRKYSKKSDIVFDPFMGSGTTAVACENLERKWIGVEIIPKYFDIAKNRTTNIQQRLFE